jgi:hypothetical protein
MSGLRFPELWRRVQSRVQGCRDGLLSPLAARGVGIAAIVADHLLMGVGDVGGHQGNPVQSIHPSGQTLRGAAGAYRPCCNQEKSYESDELPNCSLPRVRIFTMTLSIIHNKKYKLQVIIEK